MAMPEMTGCQAGFSILWMMDDKRKYNEEQGRKPEEQIQRIASRNLNIIDALYEKRMIIHVTGPVDEREKKVCFQEAPPNDEDAEVYDGVDLEMYFRALEWMPTVHRIEVVYGLSLGK